MQLINELIAMVNLISYILYIKKFQNFVRLCMCGRRGQIIIYLYIIATKAKEKEKRKTETPSLKFAALLFI